MAENTPSNGDGAAAVARQMDVMVATFNDSQAAKDAYDALKSLEREGRIKLSGAVVVDRDESGKMRVKRATLPQWMWIAIAASVVIMATGLGFTVALVVRGVMHRVRHTE
jgi:uncharacterized membrane protein